MAVYLAYGSNMDPEQMRARCPDAPLLGPARIPGRRLAFTRMSVRTFPGSGVADLVPDAGLTAWGALYRVTDDDLRTLDDYEGAGSAYRRVTIAVRPTEDSDMAAVTYVVARPSPSEIPPSPAYLERMLAGAHHCRLPAAYLAFLESLRHPGALGRSAYPFARHSTTIAPGAPTARGAPSPASSYKHSASSTSSCPGNASRPATT
jgi:gamma-glutamylcyclotransferase (GGCT)/AIG2-like uncharacterized protein YtfP